jgi:hypothetical protein
MFIAYNPIKRSVCGDGMVGNVSLPPSFDEMFHAHTHIHTHTYLELTYALKSSPDRVGKVAISVLEPTTKFVSRT